MVQSEDRWFLSAYVNLQISSQLLGTCVISSAFWSRRTEPSPAVHILYRPEIWFQCPAVPPAALSPATPLFSTALSLESHQKFFWDEIALSDKVWHGAGQHVIAVIKTTVLSFCSGSPLLSLSCAVGAFLTSTYLHLWLFKFLAVFSKWTAFLAVISFSLCVLYFPAWTLHPKHNSDCLTSTHLWETWTA